MERQIEGIQINKQTDEKDQHEQIDGQRERDMYEQKIRQNYRKIDKKYFIQRNWQVDRQIDRYMDRQIDTDRQIDKWMAACII